MAFILPAKKADPRPSFPRGPLGPNRIEYIFYRIEYIFYSLCLGLVSQHKASDQKS